MRCPYCNARKRDISAEVNAGRSHFYICGTVSPFGYLDTQSDRCRISELEQAVAKILGWRENDYYGLGDVVITIEGVATKALKKYGRNEKKGAHNV